MLPTKFPNEPSVIKLANNGMYLIVRDKSSHPAVFGVATAVQ